MFVIWQTHSHTVLMFRITAGLLEGRVMSHLLTTRGRWSLSAGLTDTQILCPKSSHLPSFTFSYLLRQVLMMEPPSLPLLLHNPTLPLSLFLFLSPSVSLSVSLSPPLSLSPFLSLSPPNRWRQRADDHWVWFCWRFLPVKKDSFSCYCRPALAHGRNVGSL